MKIKYLALLISLPVFTASGGSVLAGPEFDSETQVKIARFKARQKLEFFEFPIFERPDFRGFQDNQTETPCGAIDLASVNNRSITRGADGITVIIDGDVINANNVCR